MNKKRIYKVPNLKTPAELIDPKEIKKVYYSQLGNGRIVKDDEKD